MFSALSGKPVAACMPHETIPPQYPADFFRNNKNTKPHIRIPMSELDLDRVRKFVHAGIIDRNKLKLPHAMRYLFLVLSKIKEKLDNDWKSFGVTIGLKDQDLDPFCMYVVHHDAGPQVDGTESTTVGPEDDDWMVMYLLGIYRLGRTQNDTHKGNLATRLLAQMKSLNPRTLNITNDDALQNIWVGNTDYCKLIAGIDMYFNRFKKSDFAYLRFGTIPSRFKDCASLLSIGHVCNLTGMTLEEYLGWIFVATVGREIESMMKEGNEVDQPFSYMPYMMEMGLSMKSPYSSAASPGVYTLAHIIGTLLFSERSKNARMVSENNLSNIRINAEIVAYVRARKGSLMKVFHKDKASLEAAQAVQEDNGSVDVLLGDLPAGNDPDEWFTTLEINQFELPHEIRTHTISESRKIGNTRAHTIGHHVATTFV
nr:nucleoprotein [Yata virus]